MRNFRIHIMAFVLVLIGLSVWAGMLYAGERHALAGVTAVCALAVAVGLYRRIRLFVRVMADYISGMEMDDTSMRIEGDPLDRELREMAAGMNRIAERYFRNRRDLETRKLYYDRILRVMTHEMRNSIAPVASLSADIAGHPEAYSPAEIQEAIEIIRDSSAGINRFLDSYRTLTHLPAPEKVSLEADTFFRQLFNSCDVFRRKAGLPDDTLSFKLAEGICFKADPALLTQALVNILKNALESVAQRFFPGTGNDAGVGMSPDFKPMVEVKVTRSGGGISVIVADNGVGLPRSMASDPFQPFVTTKEGGSGIGLFLTRQLIRLHGGEIRITDNPGRGVIVSLSIP